MGELKLYVVGETSGNPEDWCEYPYRALVIARSAEEAVSMVEVPSFATEVRFDKPAVLSADHSGVEFRL